MSHLTDEQLSGFMDDALDASARATCETHLASCEPCRERLAEWSALERELAPALTHDPGEEYFASFSERVRQRLASGQAAGEAASGRAQAPRRSPWGWLLSPRGLSFAGGTAALLLAAGVAWLRFHQPDDAASTLRTAAPPLAANATLDDKQKAVPPAAAEPTASRAGEARQIAARADANARRLLASNPMADGASAPVPAPQVTAEVRNEQQAESAAGAPAEVKQRATPSASGAIAQKTEARTLWNTTQKLFATPAPPAAPTEPQALAPAPARTKDAPELRDAAGALAKSAKPLDELRVRESESAKLQTPHEESPALPVLAVQCGKVTDSRGTPVQGAQIMLLGASTRSARSAPDGSFCLPQAMAGDTLILMHVGFEPLRIVLTPTTSLALGLEPVGTLGARGGMALGGAPQGFVRSQGGAAANAPVPDVYAAQSEVVRVAVAAARARSAVARRDHTVGGWEAAAAGWDSVGTSATGAAAYDARFQSLSALRAAARIAPTPERRQRLRSALAAFLAQAPRALPERATAERWLNELAPRAPK